MKYLVLRVASRGDGGFTRFSWLSDLARRTHPVTLTVVACGVELR